jgi:hypothetical protein
MNDGPHSVDEGIVWRESSDEDSDGERGRPVTRVEAEGHKRTIHIM